MNSPTGRKPSQPNQQSFPIPMTEEAKNEVRRIKFAFTSGDAGVFTFDADTIFPGDYVRSYDFPGRTGCYIEGPVLRIEEVQGCDRYVIAVETRVLPFDPEDPYANEGAADFLRGWEVCPPVNGDSHARRDEDQRSATNCGPGPPPCRLLVRGRFAALLQR